ASMIEEVLRHDTEMDVEKQYVDTHRAKRSRLRILASAGFCTSAAAEEPQEAALIPAVQWRAISQSSGNSDPADQLGDHRTAIRRAHQTDHGVAAWDSWRRIDLAALYQA